MRLKREEVTVDYYDFTERQPSSEGQSVFTTNMTIAANRWSTTDGRYGGCRVTYRKGGARWGEGGCTFNSVLHRMEGRGGKKAGEGHGEEEHGGWVGKRKARRVVGHYATAQQTN